jgi:hypothetical protein
VQLNWHYRSQNQALIDFNNPAFYKNELQTLPERNSQTEHFPKIETNIPTKRLLPIKIFFKNHLDQSKFFLLSKQYSLRSHISNNQKRETLISFSKNETLH